MTAREWRDKNTITDWEFAEIGRLLCDGESRDLALKVVRLEGENAALRMLQRQTGRHVNPTTI
jgi:hypothetical protein